MSAVTPKQMRYLIKNPQAMMKFQATGVLPQTRKAPSSPLIDLLEKLPPRLRLQIRGVRLHPHLGYQTSMQFHNAEQLFRWLRPERELVGNETTPSESYRNKGFVKKLTLEELREFCASWPKPEIFRLYGVNPDCY